MGIASALWISWSTGCAYWWYRSVGASCHCLWGGLTSSNWAWIVTIILWCTEWIRICVDIGKISLGLSYGNTLTIGRSFLSSWLGWCICIGSANACSLGIGTKSSGLGLSKWTSIWYRISRFLLTGANRSTICIDKCKISRSRTSCKSISVCLIIIMQVIGIQTN